MLVLTTLFCAQGRAVEESPDAIREPEAASVAAGHFSSIGGSFGLEEYTRHFAPNEPNYFLAGWLSPQVKFQISFRYMILNPTGSLVQKHAWMKGFNFGFSQTSWMNITTLDDSFFADSSYRPELFYYFENFLPTASQPVQQLGLQGGIGHESNGFKQSDHRSLNIFFLRPLFTLGSQSKGLFLTVAPKFYYYFGPIALNPDIANYRGYCDLRVTLGQRDGLQLAVLGRVGSHFDKGSLQLDLTYALTKIFDGNFDVSLDVQYFVGYGDTIQTYRDFSSMLRFGVALVR